MSDVPEALPEEPEGTPEEEAGEEEEGEPAPVGDYPEVENVVRSDEETEKAENRPTEEEAAKLQEQPEQQEV